MGHIHGFWSHLRRIMAEDSREDSDPQGKKRARLQGLGLIMRGTKNCTIKQHELQRKKVFHRDRTARMNVHNLSSKAGSELGMVAQA